jgi:hypothetical protein
MIGEGIQKSRYACDDMTAVDRIIDETYAMERYIDAHAGGPGLGWFRVVHTPAEAREVIAGARWPSSSASRPPTSSTAS